MQLRSLGAAVLAAGVVFGGAAPALATGGGNDTSSKLRRAVTVDGIRVHQGALNLISLLSDGNRLAGAPGYERSADYVALRARLAGLNVSRQAFDYDAYLLADWKAPILSERFGKRYVPGIAGSILGGDFGSMVNSPAGDVTGRVWATDLELDPTVFNSVDSGCEAADFAGMPRDAIALIQRGVCPFATKFMNAQNAGAGGIVFINENGPPNPNDPTDDRVGPFWTDIEFLGIDLDIPIVAAQVDTVRQLSRGVTQGLTGRSARLRVDWRTGTHPTNNVIAETRGGDPNKVIVVGAHLDSVGVGAGSNDNGSGSAAILEIAEQLRGVFPKNKIRFMWFSAEEHGLLGSEAYVDSLPESERAKIAAMLNFDMIGSPNFVNFVYDGDLSDSPPIPEDVFAPAARPFSATIEKIFLDYFRAQRIPTEPTDFDGRSDYGPFIAAGVPAGGLFTGAEGIKTPEQAAIFGGTAGEQFDPCYHLGCDTVFNNSNRALDIHSDAAAHALITLAQMRIPDRPAAAPAAAQRRAAAGMHGTRVPAPSAMTR
jgi:hypothetical protein